MVSSSFFIYWNGILLPKNLKYKAKSNSIINEEYEKHVNNKYLLLESCQLIFFFRMLGSDSKASSGSYDSSTKQK